MLTGSFRASRTFPHAWDTAAAGGAGTGELRIGPIVLGRTFGLHVGGYLGYPGTSLRWEIPGDGTHRELAARTPPGAHWAYYQWDVPRYWVGRSVYVVATDRSPNVWLGVSEPEPVPWMPALGMAALQIACFLLIFLPGMAWLLWRGEGAADALLASGLAGYACFWAYFLSADLGKAFSWIILLGSAGLVLAGMRKPERRRRASALVPALTFALLLGVAYLGLLMLYGGAEATLELPQDRFLPGMPPDTQIPFLLSDVWYRHLPVHPFLGDWLTSDRPPLQAALHLLISPLVPREPAAECVGIVAQSWIFIALWSVLDAIGATAAERKIALLLAALSGFMLFNCTFVWPKLLPAALLLLAFAEMERRPGRTPLRVGLLGGLAMLGHAGSAFALLGLALWYLWRRCPGGWAYMVRAGGILIACLVPWVLYQKVFDPPGDRLLKWHLAGAPNPTASSFGSVLVHAYRTLGWKSWLAGRWENVSHLFFGPGWHSLAKMAAGMRTTLAGGHMEGWMRAALELRVNQMFLFFPSLGILLAGLLPLARPGAAAPTIRFARSLLAVATAVLILWCLLMFQPDSTVNHQGTYFTNVCWMLALGIGIAQYPRPVQGILVLLQAALFLGGWVPLSSHSVGTDALLPAMQAPSAVLAAAAGAAAIFSLFAARTAHRAASP